MKSVVLLLMCILFSVSSFAAENKTSASNASNSSRMLGMSVTGNKESPRSLTIVPWRSPSMDGKTPEVSPVWQPTLGLLDPDSYRRDINLFLKHQQQKSIN